MIKNAVAIVLIVFIVCISVSAQAAEKSAPSLILINNVQYLRR